MAHDKTVPSFTIPDDTTKRIVITISASDASIIDQGYTYNEVGFSYNQINVDYGGIVQANHDHAPTLVTASVIKPSIYEIEDIYIHPNVPPGPNNQTTVGVGWFMFISQ